MPGRQSSPRPSGRGDPGDQAGDAGPYRYRPDIDGLRAVAVTAVLLSHLGASHFAGGFVGVDVFFVISGYLVGSHVLFQYAGGAFSLAGFYERRVRRIIPALVVLLAGVLLLSSFLDFPVQMSRLSESGLAALFSSSNVYFWAHTGYFATPGADAPLLHTWSLGVEEQFYIVFPLVVWLARAGFGARGVRPALLALCAASLGLSAIGAFMASSATFYLLPTRAWELLAGTLLSQNLAPTAATPVSRNFCSVVGGALIAGPILFYAPQIPFPGLAALPPCLGALLIIAAGETGPSVVGRMLSSRPMVFIGLISYSLYLWHWPLIVYQHRWAILYAGSSRLIDHLAIVGAALVAATLSWLLVERPFRNRQRVSTPVAWGAAAGAAIVLAGVMLAMFASGGWPERYPAHVRALASYLGYSRTTARAAFRDGTCHITADDRLSDFRPSLCLDARPGTPSVLLIGDSHAADLWSGLSAALPGVSVLQATASGCRPRVIQPADDKRPCDQLMRFLYGQFLTSRPFLRVVVSAQWSSADVPFVVERARWAKAHGVPMLIVGPTPEYARPLPALLASAAMGRGGADLVTRSFDRGRAGVDEQLKQALAPTGVPYVSLLDALCHGAQCQTLVGPDTPLEFDTGHLTAAGSSLVGGILRPAIVGEASSAP
ncbi:MAG TPA: acyltransferase family protein [Caulobacteraceae bacterium]|jgi:peptidoglycan/LPS O-acetylase OafA/YrhL|nr:acyltransferase family protein [Caulobacteraceae bacterium]